MVFAAPERPVLGHILSSSSLLAFKRMNVR
jgi:hypothetical protein